MQGRKTTQRIFALINFHPTVVTRDRVIILPYPPPPTRLISMISDGMSNQGMEIIHYQLLFSQKDSTAISSIDEAD